MTLPKSFTTVTTLSKTIALGLLILLPIIGFTLGMNYQKTLSPLQGADPRTQVFETQQECESFTSRACVPTLCEQDSSHPTCKANNQTGWYATRTDINNESITPTPQQGQILEFEGVLTGFVEDCSVDIECVAIVDGYEIVIEQGNVANPLPTGKTDIWTDDVGQTVQVKAMVVKDNQLTIVGSLDLYAQKVSETDTGTACQSNNGTWIAEYNECEYISKHVCDELGGRTYNECASACRHNPEAQICTEQCVPVCGFPHPEF